LRKLPDGANDEIGDSWGCLGGRGLRRMFWGSGTNIEQSCSIKPSLVEPRLNMKFLAGREGLAPDMLGFSRF